MASEYRARRDSGAATEHCVGARFGGYRISGLALLRVNRLLKFGGDVYHLDRIRSGLRGTAKVCTCENRKYENEE
jgi:hypothetical protein